MVLFNASPQTLSAKAEGTAYVFGPKQVREVGNEFHARKVIEQIGPRGLMVIPYGKKAEDFEGQGMRIFQSFVQSQVDALKAHNAEMTKQKKPISLPNEQLMEMVALAEGALGRKFSVMEGHSVVEDLTQALSAVLARLSGTVPAPPTKEEVEEALEGTEGEPKRGRGRPRKDK